MTLKRSPIKKKPRSCKICGKALYDIGKAGCHLWCYKKENPEYDPMNRTMPKPKKRVKKKVRLKSMKDKLDRMFSVMIRLRDTDRNGNGVCISSGKPIWYRITDDGRIVSNCDIGHLHRRNKYSVRWDEFNCNAEDRGSNRSSENVEGYKEGFIKKYGQEALEELNARAEQPLSTLDIRDFVVQKIKDVEPEVKKLLETKNWWHNQRPLKTLF